MVAAPQCSFLKADIAKVAQHLRGSMTAMRDFSAVGLVGSNGCCAVQVCHFVES
jgi:hypothetical protein